MTPRPSRRHVLLAAGSALAAPGLVRAQTPMTIEAHYSMPLVFKDVQEQIAEAFNRRNPDVRVVYRQPTPGYDDGLQLILRQAATDQLPDVTFQGLNRLRILAERGLVTDLAPYLAREGDPRAAGYTPELLGLGRFGGMQAALAFATSNPIVFVNRDLMRRAGVDPDQPIDGWDRVVDIGARVARLGDGIMGTYYRWQGDWMFSALLFGFGGRMMSPDEREVAFSGPAGLQTLSTLDRLVREGGMRPLAGEAGAQAFLAGRVGLYFWSTAFLRATITGVGRNFELGAARFPLGGGAAARLPTGGAGAMVLARDPARREAAWRFVRFATGVEGCTMMVKGTGYVPVNQLALDEPQHLAAFYAENPLFRTGVAQMPIMVPWYAFPGANGVRISQVIIDHSTRVAESRAAPAEALADMAGEVGRLLPRAG